MYCEEVKGLIQLYLDDELDARSTLHVQQHLESCTVCLYLLNSFIKQDQRLRQAAHEETIDSSRLRERILAATALKATWYQRSPNWLTLPVIKRTAAVLAILLALSFLLLRGNLFPYVNQQVYAAAASDHTRCITGASRGEIINMDELKEFVARFGKMKSIPNLTAFGYGPPHAILCRIKGEKFLHLIFYHPEGRPLSLYMRPRTSELIAPSPTSLKLEEYGIFSTSLAGVDLLIVSSLDEARASLIAQAIAQQINR
jgi:anti-sigma factor RsiW